MFCPLGDAIALHQNALKEGKEILIFPPDCEPNNFSTEIAYDFSTEINYMQPPVLGETGGLTNLAILKRCNQSQPIAN